MVRKVRQRWEWPWLGRSSIFLELTHGFELAEVYLAQESEMLLHMNHAYIPKTFLVTKLKI